MKIGLYFGTFNPIHNGHLIIANHMAEYSDLDQIWMVVTPHNPLKNKNTLLQDSVRLELVYLATEDYPKIKPSDIEFKLPQPIMGEDNLKSLQKWKNYDVILKNYPIYVYPRISSDLENSTFMNSPNIHFIDAPIVEISSTFIRENIKNKKNVQPLLPSKVWEYIDHNNIYKK
jgi:nicotinate-nucleotide adenylyltransferase